MVATGASWIRAAVNLALLLITCSGPDSNDSCFVIAFITFISHVKHDINDKHELIKKEVMKSE